MDRHIGVLLTEGLEIAFVIEVLRLQREPLSYRTARTDRFLFHPFGLDVAVAGDRSTVGTVGVRLVETARVTVDAAMDPVLRGDPRGARRVVLVGIGVLFEIGRGSSGT